MNTLKIQQKLDYLEQQNIASRCHPVVKIVHSVLNGQKEIKPVSKVGYGKNSRYIDWTESCVNIFNFLKISHVLETSKKGKINLIIRIVI